MGLIEHKLLQFPRFFGLANHHLNHLSLVSNRWVPVKSSSKMTIVLLFGSQQFIQTMIIFDDDFQTTMVMMISKKIGHPIFLLFKNDAKKIGDFQNDPIFPEHFPEPAGPISRPPSSQLISEPDTRRGWSHREMVMSKFAMESCDEPMKKRGFWWMFAREIGRFSAVFRA